MSDDPAPRRAKRDSILRMAQILIPETGATTTARIRNVSDTGACVDLIAGIAPGQTLEVAIGKEPAVAARVAWVSEQQFGIAFDRLAPVALEVQFHASRAVPKAGWMANMSDKYRG